MADLAAISVLLRDFSGHELSAKLKQVEGAIAGMTLTRYPAFLLNTGADRKVLAAAADLKKLAGQINVLIHALGILLCLPRILEKGETVQYVSLGAGNTGRKFDLETDRRIAEFKFIQWRGGAESIRQNSVFKDYFELARCTNGKQRYLYLLGTEHPLRFLNSRRALDSVLSRNVKLKATFRDLFGDRYRTVGEYYRAHSREVKIVDVAGWLSELAAAVIVEEPEDE